MFHRWYSCQHLHFYRIRPNWRDRGGKLSCCPEWNILILWHSEKHSKVMAYVTTPSLIHMLFCTVGTVILVLQLQMRQCLLSWWRPVYCYGVLQWRRLAPEDPATENHTVLHWWCRIPQALCVCFKSFHLVQFHWNVFLFRSCSGLLRCVLPLGTFTINEFCTEI